MSVLTDLGQLLETRSVGILWTDIFLGRRPAEPDTCLTLQTYQGDPNRLHGDSNVPADERLAVQVMARAADQGDAEALAESAYTKIAFRSKTLNGNRYAWCRANTRPAYVGVDANDRALVSFNVTLRRDRTTDLMEV